jgi:phosphatidate cytidylyltransferase
VSIILYSSPIGFFLFLSLIIICGLYEFYDLLAQRGIPHWPWLGISSGWGMVGWFAWHKGDSTSLPFSLLLIVYFFIGFCQKDDSLQHTLQKIVYTLFGVIYVGWLLAHLYLIYTLHHGTAYLLYLLLVVWLGDSVALYVGRHWGHHTLAPRISPKKTIEGALGGWGGSMVGAFLAHVSFVPALTSLDSVITGTMIAVLGQMGDLSESLLKRSVGAKDSSTLIPGHGGLLDKIDGLLFSAPAFYYYLVFVMEQRL